MIKPSKNCLVLFIIIASLFLISTLIFITKIDYSGNIPQYISSRRNDSFELGKYLANIKVKNYRKDFPYKIYLDSGDVDNIKSITKDLVLMDSINSSDRSLNMEVFLLALTDSLKSYKHGIYNSTNLDSLILLYQWAEKFHFHAECENKYSSLYATIYDYWAQDIANELQSLYNTKYSIKYNYKFKYLRSRLEEREYNIPVGYSNWEKALNYIIERQWSYLLNRFWIGTTFLFKLIAFSLIAITVFGYYCIIKITLNKKR